MLILPIRDQILSHSAPCRFFLCLRRSQCVRTPNGMPRFSWLMSGYANGIGPFGGQLCPDYERHEAPKIVNFVRFRTWPLPLLSWVLQSRTRRPDLELQLKRKSWCGGFAVQCGSIPAYMCRLVTFQEFSL